MSKQEARTEGELAGEGPASTVTAVEKAAVKARTASLAVPAVANTPTPVPLSNVTSSPNLLTPTGNRPNIGLHATLVTPSAQMLVRLGRYQLIERIATGGMAEVYLAVHGELAGFRTPVVLKKVLPHLASNPQFIDMFLDEARIASLLDHPNVVRIYEVGRSGAEYFLAMELVQGKPLSSLLRRAHERATERESGVIDPRLAAFIIAQAAAGLHHAHNLTDPLGNPLGLVHRDISPQNILISFEGSVKVIDFGIARALGRISETQTGGMKGKFGYMSPEQARGEEVDLRTDIFALGVVLWEALTGRRLFHRENDLATMRALIYDPIPKPSSIVPVSIEIESIVMRALSRNPKLRYQTARDMGGALERYVVSAGGASGSDLGAVLKTYFAHDHSTWQQTLRTAVNLPAVTDADLAATAATPTPVASPAVITQDLQRANRRVWVSVAIAVALALGGALGVPRLLRGHDDTPTAVEPRPAMTAPATPPPPPAAQTEPAVTPLPGSAHAEPAEPIDPAHAEGANKSSTKTTPAHHKRPSPHGGKGATPDDRRPNPF